jgi:long-chain fatty acid transport protein
VSYGALRLVALKHQPDIDQYYGWRNTWFGSLGMDYKISHQWTCRAGVAYDQTPT